jgi:hypothetical protein
MSTTTTEKQTLILKSLVITIAEEFNNYYVSLADNINNNSPVDNTIVDLNKNNQLNY